ncbi:hypothetical protein [Streptomyces sp. NPDC005438]|uniref:hypothetical protein n=1 Tax=Streptomyces sp. NPDC005438 TaxID=3156880 RepID=UPI00339E846A
MSAPDRKQTEVARLLRQSVQPAPMDLAARAIDRGDRLVRRQRVVRRLAWLLAVLLVVAFTVWALRTQPWVMPPTQTTPVDW